MKEEFNKGDTVYYTKSGQYMTKGRAYTIIEGIDSDNDILIVDDEGDESFYPVDEFIYSNTPNNPNSISYAQELVGKRVLVNQDGKREIIKIEAFSVWNKFNLNNIPKSDTIMREHIANDGYCVTVEDEEGNSYTIEDIEIINNKIVINKEYTAVVEGENVQVGCQTIPISKVKEIVEVYEKLK